MASWRRDWERASSSTIPSRHTWTIPQALWSSASTSTDCRTPMKFGIQEEPPKACSGWQIRLQAQPQRPYQQRDALQGYINPPRPNWPAQPGQAQQRPPHPIPGADPDSCYRCGVLGHRAGDCPNPDRRPPRMVAEVSPSAQVTQVVTRREATPQPQSDPATMYADPHPDVNSAADPAQGS